MPAKIKNRGPGPGKNRGPGVLSNGHNFRGYEPIFLIFYGQKGARWESPLIFRSFDIVDEMKEIGSYPRTLWLFYDFFGLDTLTVPTNHAGEHLRVHVCGLPSARHFLPNPLTRTTPLTRKLYNNYIGYK